MERCKEKQASAPPLPDEPPSYSSYHEPTYPEPSHSAGTSRWSSTVINPPNLRVPRSIQKVTNNLVPFGSELSIDQIRAALVKYTEKNSLPSTAKAKEVEIVNVEYSFAHVYELLVYNQHRELKEKYCCYKAGRLDDQSMGRMPGLWELMPSSNPKLFKDHKESIYVPHSERIKICSWCSGRGKTRETRTVRRSDGSSYTETYYVTCYRCAGNGQLKYYLMNKIKWITGIDHHVATDSKIPVKKLKKPEVIGTCIFQESKVTLDPIEYTTNAEITKASQELINKSHSAFTTNTRPIQQKHLIKVIPVAFCHYLHNKKPKTFWCYGENLEVYAPGFPSNVSCCLI